MNLFQNLATVFRQVISNITDKVAGKISYSQFPTTILLKNPQRKLIIAQTSMVTGQFSRENPFVWMVGSLAIH